MRIRSLPSILAGLICCVACWGCGPAAQGNLPDLIPVKGKVTYKGKPLTKGRIKFEPDGYGRPASGQLQADGTYTLGTKVEGDGVVAGDHRISLSDLDKGLARDRTFKKFTSPNTSQLTATVDKDHTEFNFDLP